MVTFRDLKIGDSIYEADIESKKIWIDKITNIFIGKYFFTFECLDQDNIMIHADIPISEENESICKYRTVYTTNMNLLLTAICDS